MSLGRWSDADVARFVAFAVPVVTGAQTQAASLTSGYLALTLADMTGRPVAPRGIDPADVTAVRGVPAAVVYARPASTMRMSLAEGLPIEAAVERGRQRLRGLLTADVQLARTHAARLMLSGTRGVVGVRRAVTGTCELCEVASADLSDPAELMPTHPNCACAPVPVLRGDDPAEANNDALLGRLPDVAVTVYAHGELGPTLALARHTQTGVGDITQGAGFALSRMTVARLRRIATANDIELPDGLRRAELVGRIRDWERSNGRRLLPGR